MSDQRLRFFLKEMPNVTFRTWRQGGEHVVWLWDKHKSRSHWGKAATLPDAIELAIAPIAEGWN